MVTTRDEKKLFDDLYDESGTLDDLYELELNDGLSDREQQLAEFLIRWKLVRGVWLVTGIPGAGKGLFGTVLNWQIRRFFKGRKSILDYRPRALFDRNCESQPYTFFNSHIMLDELDKMAKLSGADIGESNKEKEHKLKKTELASELSKRWIESKGHLLLQNATWGLDELKKYVHKRRPTSNINVMTGNIVTVWRHLDLLIMGMTPFSNEIDGFSYLQYATHWAKCKWSMNKPDTTNVMISRARLVSSVGVFECTGKAVPIAVDGRRQRPQLGGTVININGTRLSEGEIDVVDTLVSHPAYDTREVAQVTGIDINKAEKTMEQLIDKGIIRCPCYYDLYNSKDIKNLKPALRVRV